MRSLNTEGSRGKRSLNTEGSRGKHSLNTEGSRGKDSKKGPNPPEAWLAYGSAEERQAALEENQARPGEWGFYAAATKGLLAKGHFRTCRSSHAT